MESATQRARQIRTLTLVTVGSLIGGLAIAGVKYWGWTLTQSQAVYSDVLESIVNITAGAVAIFVVRFASKPADRKHPYGHGKLEYFSAAFEGGLIAFAALMILLEAVPALIANRAIANLQDGAWIVLACGFGNFLLGIGVKHMGQKFGSPALVANGTHLQADFVTSMGVTIGLLLASWTGLFWLDPLIAVLVGGQLAWTGLRVVRRSIGGLLDEEDKEILIDFVKVLKSIDFSGVIQIHHTRIIRSGRYHHIDAHAVVPEYWNVAEAHEKTKDFETHFMRQYPQPGELHLHVDPCRRVYCARCSDKICPIRSEPFKGLLVPDLDSLIDPDEPSIFR